LPFVADSGMATIISIGLVCKILFRNNNKSDRPIFMMFEPAPTSAVDPATLSYPIIIYKKKTIQKISFQRKVKSHIKLKISICHSH